MSTFGTSAWRAVVARAIEGFGEDEGHIERLINIFKKDVHSYSSLRSIHAFVSNKKNLTAWYEHEGKRIYPVISYEQKREAFSWQGFSPFSRNVINSPWIEISLGDTEQPLRVKVCSLHFAAWAVKIGLDLFVEKRQRLKRMTLLDSYLGIEAPKTKETKRPLFKPVKRSNVPRRGNEEKTKKEKENALKLKEKVLKQLTLDQIVREGVQRMHVY